MLPFGELNYVAVIVTTVANQCRPPRRQPDNCRCDLGRLAVSYRPFAIELA